MKCLISMSQFDFKMFAKNLWINSIISEAYDLYMRVFNDNIFRSYLKMLSLFEKANQYNHFCITIDIKAFAIFQIV